MGAEDGDRPGWYLGEMLDKACALRAQAFDDMAVVNDFVPDIDRRAKLLERFFHDVDGADHAGAKAARLSKNHSHGRARRRAVNKMMGCMVRLDLSPRNDPLLRAAK